MSVIPLIWLSVDRAGAQGSWKQPYTGFSPMPALDSLEPSRKRTGARESRSAGRCCDEPRSAGRLCGVDELAVLGRSRIPSETPPPPFPAPKAARACRKRPGARESHSGAAAATALQIGPRLWSPTRALNSAL